MTNAAVTRLRLFGFAEGLSWVGLIIAMVIKRVYDQPEAIRVPGMIHGICFIVYCIALVQVMFVRKWPAARGLALFIASLIPFGTFIMDSRLKRWAQDGLQAKAKLGEIDGIKDAEFTLKND